MTLPGLGRGLAPQAILGGAFLLLVLVLGVRCTHGLDVTDEMQYYGQMIALARGRALFTTDLFIQQLVYLPLYPLLRGYWLAFGDQGLVLAGRVLLSIALLGQFWYVQHWFRQRGSQAIHAVLIALSLTFVATYHGIFAISYNSMSQMAWVVFCLWFMDWHRVPTWRWAALTVLSGFAHPAAAVAMACLLMGRWALARQARPLLAWLGWSLLLGLVALALTLCFTSVEVLEQSLRCSGGFAVGHAIWSQSGQWGWALACVMVLMLLTGRPFPVPTMLRSCTPWLMGLCLLYGVRYLAVKHLTYGYTNELARMGICLVALAAIWAASVPGDARRDGRVSALALRSALSAQFLVLVVTSSNGLAQGVGGVMLAVPLLLGLVSIPAQADASANFRPRGLTWVLSLLLLLQVVHWSNCPYRDQRWYRLPSGGQSDVSAFRHIQLSSDTRQLLGETRAAFAGRLVGQPVWIASELPVLYFALEVKPVSCMLYMHSVGGPGAEQALRACLASRDPGVVLYSTPTSPVD